MGRTNGSGEAEKRPYNILFILTDQERHFRPGELPDGYELPAHQRLRKAGTYFANHRIASCVCTSSRSVIYTGQHIQKTKMFDNTNFPWIKSLDPDMPTVGDLLREAGYYTAYKGKWHMTKEFEEVNKLGSPTKIFTAEMEAYGFSDYFGIGDIIAHTQGGYLHDGIIAAMAGSWMRGKGRELAKQAKPWFLAVNFVNPHDVMFFDADEPGTPMKPQPGLAPMARDPDDPLYAKRWDFDFPATHYQPLNEPGRPRAHADYMKSHDALVGPIGTDDAHWRRRHNNYINCLRDADRNIASVLAELDASGHADQTIIVLTADHGDLDGAHFLHAKGGTAYREQNNVPLIIVHPDVPGGRECKAVTSHLDLAPTLIAMSSAVTAENKAVIVAGLPGKDLSPVLANPDKAGPNDVREAALFNFNMLAYVDGDFAFRALDFIHQGGKGNQLKEAGILPDLRKRGAIRSVFDGRYMYARYFSPKQHNRPTTLEQIRGLNDVELYDLESDPLEQHNLADGDSPDNELVLAMNEKMNRLIDAEVGDDPGDMMPAGIEGGWEVSAETMKGF